MALRLIRRAGTGRERLRAWRRRAQAARRASPLFDTRRAVRRLEAGLRIAWDAAAARADGSDQGGGGTLAPVGVAEAAATVAVALAGAAGVRVGPDEDRRAAAAGASALQRGWGLRCEVVVAE